MKIINKHDGIFYKIASYINTRAFRLLLLWVGILALLYTFFSIVLYQHFDYGGFDLGVLDQAIWQYSRFISSSYSTIYEKIIFGIHFTPSLVLFAPLYWLWNDVRMLIIFQAVWMSFSAIAVYKLALLRNLLPIVALSIALVYSLFWSIQQAISVEFHPMVFGAGLLAWFAYFFESGNKRWFWITLIVLLGTEEIVGLFLAGLGVFYLFYPKYRSWAWWFIIGGILYIFIAIHIVTQFSPGGYEHYPHISLNPITNLTRLFDTPGKRQIWWLTLSSFSFLPLLSPGAIFAVVFYLAQWFVSSDGGYPFSAMWKLHTYQYAGLGIYLALGAMDAFSFLKKKHIGAQRIAFVMVFLSVISTVCYFPLSRLLKNDFWKSEPWMEGAWRLFARIPPNASLATQASFLPYLAHRKQIYVVNLNQHIFVPSPCALSVCWWLDFNKKADYLVVSRLQDGDFVRGENASFQEALATRSVPVE